MEEPTKEQLTVWANKISKSDSQAFDDLFHALYPRLVRFALKYVKQRSAAGDIVQNAFIALWENRMNIDPDLSIKAYLYRIVRNRALNFLRDHANKMVGLENATNDYYEIPDVSDNPASDHHPSKLSKKFMEWISELPSRQHEAFRLSRFDGLDHDEIAEVMDISANTVNNHIVAALQYLRDRYHEYENTATS